MYDPTQPVDVLEEIVEVDDQRATVRVGVQDGSIVTVSLVAEQGYEMKKPDAWFAEAGKVSRKALKEARKNA